MPELIWDSQQNQSNNIVWDSTKTPDVMWDSTKSADIVWDSESYRPWEHPTREALKKTSKEAIQSFTPENIGKNLLAAGEAVGALATGMAGFVAGVPPLVAGGPKYGIKAAEKVGEAVTYQPVTEQGKQLTGIVSKPFELFTMGEDKFAEFAVSQYKTLEETEKEIGDKELAQILHNADLSPKTREWLARSVFRVGLLGLPLLKKIFGKSVTPAEVVKEATKNPEIATKLKTAATEELSKVELPKEIKPVKPGEEIKSAEAPKQPWEMTREEWKYDQGIEEPSGYLYHGTQEKNLGNIRRNGLESQTRQRNDWEEGDRGPSKQELLYFEGKENKNWGGKDSAQLRVNKDMLPEGVDIGKDQLRPGEFYTHHAKNEFYSIPPEAIEYYDTKLKQWKPMVEDEHIASVQQALAEGKPVPPEVLKDYPELQAGKGLISETGGIKIGKQEKPIFANEALKVEEMYERADKTSKELHKKTLGKAYKSLKTQTIDVAGNLKKTLLQQGEEGKRIVVNHDLIAGASTKSMRDFQLVSDKIFKGLNETEREYLNRFIQSKRTIAIEGYKQIKHSEGLGAKEHQTYLNQIPKDLSDALNKRANLYFEEMQGQLKQLLDEKIITKESYDALISKGDYSPRRFLQYIDPEVTHEIGGKKITVPDSGIKALDEGSYGLLEKDAPLLLNQIISRTQGRIFKNRANRELYRFAETVPDNGVVQLAKVIKTTKEGKPVYQKAPAGYEKVKVMIEGQTKEMLMPAEMANEWITRDPILTAGQANAMRWISGSAILKPMATGLNPEFAITNFPRDLAHVWITDYSRVYSPHLPVYMAQIAKDLVTVSKDAITRKGRWVDYINEGGGMEFLTHQGRITTSLGGFWKNLQTAMGWLGETSEILPRLALRERGIKGGLSSTEATWRARDYLDFSQGGSFIKAADTVIPYLNAGIQGTRGVFKAAAMKPGVFAYKVAQIGTLATSLYYLNRFSNPEAWEQVSPREKVNNFIITTPFSYQDAEGNQRYIYFKIAKDQGQRTMASIFEGMAGKVVGDTIDTDQIAQSVQDAIPIIPSQTLPPLIDALLGYGANKDFWRNEEIWKGPKVETKEEWTYYTHPLFKETGRLTGLSPERLKYALQQYFTYGNVWTSLGGFAWKQILDELPEAEKQKITEDIILQKPFIRRIAKKTDPYIKYEKPLEKAETEAVTEQYKITRKFDLLSQRYYDKIATKSEVERFYKDVPVMERKRLIQRHIRRGKLQEIPEKRYWLNLAEISSPEAKATVFWNRWRTANKEEQKRLEKECRRIPGIISGRFFRQLEILKKKNLQLEQKK